MGDHYVPHCYLKNFAIDPNTKSNKQRIYVYDKIMKVHRIQRLEEIAHENDYNTVDTHLDKKYYEKTYSQIEAEYGPFLKRLIEAIRSGAPGFTEESKELFAHFIAVQMARQPNNRVIHQKQALAAGQEVERMMKEGILPDEPLANKRLAELKTDNYKEIMLQDIVPGREEDVRGLMGKAWVYWYNPINVVDTPFITSDNPVGVQIQGPLKGNFASPNVALLYPIAPDICLYMMDHSYYRGMEKEDYNNRVHIMSDFDKQFTLTVNSVQRKYCKRCIFSHIDLEANWVN